MIELIFLGLGIIYFLILLSFYLGIIKVERQPPGRKDWKPKVSILIPARDEADRIVPTLETLLRQTYPAEKLEVIIIDDHSTDNTAEVVEQFINKKKLDNFKLLSHQMDGRTPTYKKSAITFGLGFAQGEIIMTTDADCLVKPKWVESTISQYDEETGMVAGIITYERSSEKSLIHKLQTLEFSGLVFAGVGAVGINSPIICNGSNLSYRRRAFEEVGGFKGHDHLLSGDDDLLMQNLHTRTRWKIKYNLSPQAVNYTQPAANVEKFLQQRSRWASKGAHYPGFKIVTMLLVVYLFYVALFLGLPLALSGWFPLKIWLVGFSLKIIPEILIVRKALLFLNRRDLLPYIFIAEILQIPYILIAGFRGFFKLFKWK